MRIHNVHERTLPIDARRRVGAGRLARHAAGPAVAEGPLAGDAAGASDARAARVRHATASSAASRARRLRFRFRDMPGFDGEHGFEVAARGRRRVGAAPHDRPRDARGPIELGPGALYIRRLHDALLEDLLDRAEGRPPRRHGLAVRAAGGQRR